MSPVDSLPTVNEAKCSGCGRCVAACPEKLITLDVQKWRKVALISAPDQCDSCRLCQAACPVAALM